MPTKKFTQSSAILISIIMEVIYLKLIFLFASFLISLLSFLPEKLKNSYFSQLFTTLGKNFSGGIFLGIAFLDLLPECYSLISPSIAGILVISSYFFMLYIEKVAFTSHSLVSHGSKHQDLGCHHESEHSEEEEQKIKHILSTRTRLYSHLSEGDGEKCSMVCQDSLDSPLLSTNPKHSSVISPIFLALALSIHSIIEGIALGLQSDYYDFLKLGLAIFIHKVPEAIVVGITLVETESKLKLPLSAIYVSATPIGILIGALLSVELNESIEGVFLSICVGTFIYVSASEIFVEEFAVARRKYQKLTSAIVGFSLIALGAFIE